MKQRLSRPVPRMVGVFAAIVGLACATSHSAMASSKAEVNPSLLAGFSADQMAPVKQQQKAVDEATSQKGEVAKEQSQAERQVSLAQSDLDAAKANLKRAKSDADIAHKTYNEAKKPTTQLSGAARPMDIDDALQKMGKADEAVRTAQAGVDAEQMKLDYIKSLKTYSDRKVTMAEKEIDLQNAKLEKSRFVALNSANPEQARKMKLSAPQFDASVAEKQADVAKANADVTQARADATTKYRTWVAQGESQMPSGKERAAVPQPPKG